MQYIKDENINLSLLDLLICLLIMIKLSSLETSIIGRKTDIKDIILKTLYRPGMKT